MVTESDKVVTGGLASLTKSYGVMSLYIFIVVTIGSFVRRILISPIETTPYMEIGKPDDLIELCEGMLRYD